MLASRFCLLDHRRGLLHLDDGHRKQGEPEPVRIAVGTPRYQNPRTTSTFGSGPASPSSTNGPANTSIHDLLLSRIYLLRPIRQHPIFTLHLLLLNTHDTHEQMGCRISEQAFHGAYNGGHHVVTRYRSFFHTLHMHGRVESEGSGRSRKMRGTSRLKDAPREPREANGAPPLDGFLFEYEGQDRAVERIRML